MEIVKYRPTYGKTTRGYTFTRIPCSDTGKGLAPLHSGSGGEASDWAPLSVYITPFNPDCILLIHTLYRSIMNSLNQESLHI